MAASAPRLRSDLAFIEQVYRGEKSYVVKDLGTQRYFRFGVTEVRVMRAFDGHRSTGEVVAYLAEQGLRVSAETVERFARKLTDAGFLERTLAERTTLELERLRAERGRRRRHTFFRGELLRMRWSFADPDALLENVLPRIRWMFTPAFVAISLVLFAAYFIVLGEHFPEYTAALRSTYAPAHLSLWHIVVFTASGLGVVLIHELGHAFTCKYFGGEVHELGFMLLYFQPAFYCNVSDAWSFPERRARLWVTAAGSWIQLDIAAIAALIWVAAAPGTLIAEISVAAMLVGGAMTLLTNMNPLLPLDGYFALTDWLEIPNLRHRALAHVSWWIQRKLVRLERPEPETTRRERKVFLIYGGLAATYILLTLTLFASFVVGWARTTFGVVGGLTAVAALVYMMRNSLLSWSRTLLLAARTHRASWTRRLRSKAALALLMSVVILGFVVPWPLVSSGTMLVAPAASRVITAADSAVVSEVLVGEGARVAAGATVARLLDYQLARERLSASRAVDSLTLAELAARAAGRNADAEALAASRRAAEAGWTALERRADRLTLRAPIAGTVLTMHPEDLVGRAVNPGDSLLVLAMLDSFELRITLNGAGATRVRPGNVVQVVSYANPGSAWTGRVGNVSLAAVGPADGTTGVEARIHVPPNDVWRCGDVGEATVEIGRSSIFGALWWKMRQWTRADLWL